MYIKISIRHFIYKENWREQNQVSRLFNYATATFKRIYRGFRQLDQLFIEIEQ